MTTTLDQTDLQLLRLLQNDASLTNKQLGLKLHKAGNTLEMPPLLANGQ